jgi:murein DD-endopeptidase MepM/ murein hydrolase activator NlpD
VFWSFIISNQEVSSLSFLSKNIFPEVGTLKSTTIWVKSDFDISSYRFLSNCWVDSRFIKKEWSISYFSLALKDEKCKNPYFSLGNDKKVLSKSSIKIEIVTKLSLYSVLLDLSDEQLADISQDIDQESKKLALYKDFEEKENTNYFEYAQKKRRLQEILYKQVLIKEIQEKRKIPYLIPIKWGKLPTELSKIPNAGRPYRAWFTDAIHHAWDIDTAVGTSIQNIDEGIIVRIVDSWEWASLSNIRKKKWLTREDMERNLDILRGNQIWIKTMKWEVVMYNHMESISTDLEEWSLIERGTIIGTTGVTWVPEHGYKDAHLDFSIRENPYLTEKAGKYEIEDYMYWNWKMKGKSVNYIMEHQNELFESSLWTTK